MSHKHVAIPSRGNDHVVAQQMRRVVRPLLRERRPSWRANKVGLGTLAANHDPVGGRQQWLPEGSELPTCQLPVWWPVVKGHVLLVHEVEAELAAKAVVLRSCVGREPLAAERKPDIRCLRRLELDPTASAVDSARCLRKPDLHRYGCRWLSRKTAVRHTNCELVHPPDTEPARAAEPFPGNDAPDSAGLSIETGTDPLHIERFPAKVINTNDESPPGSHSVAGPVDRTRRSPDSQSFGHPLRPLVNAPWELPRRDSWTPVGNGRIL